MLDLPVLFSARYQWDFVVAFISMDNLSDILPTLLEVSVDSHLHSAVFTSAFQPRAQNEEVRAF